MSAFLGPIHFWLYHKIQLQQEVVDDLIQLGEKMIPNLGSKLESQYGVFERRPLEEVIDQGNIHGWLQECVSQVEYKLAYVVTTLLEKDPGVLMELKEVFRRNGEKNSPSEKELSAPDAYKQISDSLLDGMPCDHAFSVAESNPDQVILKQNTCVHKSFWDEVRGDIGIYYELRNAFIQGILKDTGLEYVTLGETTCIRRIGQNE